MATSVKITTPIPTADLVARRLGIKGERRRAISRLAQETIATYGQQQDAAKFARKKAKAA